MNYYLAEACQNTFILLDCLKLSTLDETFLKEARDLLEQEGRDDVLILMRGKSEGSRFYAHMAVWGLDGTLGEFCGNGARACAAYLFNNYTGYKDFFLTTAYGEHPLTQQGEGVYSVKLPSPRLQSFINYVEVIEPHLVIPKEMTEGELLNLGRELNGHKELFPRGMNVNAYHALDADTISIKTYERGVQRLTRACGTGSVACAAFHKQGGCGTVQVLNPGGSLEVTLLDDGVVLTGEASYV